MNTLGWIITAIVCIYIAVCFGKIAAKHGKNPILFGILSIISPINLTRRNLVPIFSMIAGEGIGSPRCRVMNPTTWPATCNLGT